MDGLRSHSGRIAPSISESNLSNLDCFLTWSPVRLAKATRLQSLNDAQGFINRTTNTQIMHDLVSKNSLWIDYEQSTKSDASVLDQHAVVPRNLLGRVAS